ncbi:MAG: hypothetical protein RJQ14_15370, partial [Marinoscillum sp.]
MQRAHVEKGEYYFESLEEDSRYNAPTFDISPTDDFEIEVSISGPEDELGGYYGVILGQLKLDSSFLDFKINNSGQFFIETNYPIITGEFEQSDFKTFKKLTIRKFENQFYFFINEELKYSYPADELINFRTGPVANGNSAVWL